MHIRVALILGVVLMFASTMTALAEDFKEGKWSMTLVSHSDAVAPDMAVFIQREKSMPQVETMMEQKGIHISGNGQDVTLTGTHCLTKQNPMPPYAQNAQTDCQATHDIKGNVVHFTLNCFNNNLQMESKGVMTFSGDSMKGQIEAHEMAEGKPVNITTQITGQYAGACTN